MTDRVRVKLRDLLRIHAKENQEIDEKQEKRGEKGKHTSSSEEGEIRPIEGSKSKSITRRIKKKENGGGRREKESEQFGELRKRRIKKKKKKREKKRSRREKRRECMDKNSDDKGEKYELNIAVPEVKKTFEEDKSKKTKESEQEPEKKNVETGIAKKLSLKERLVIRNNEIKETQNGKEESPELKRDRSEDWEDKSNRKTSENKERKEKPKKMKKVKQVIKKKEKKSKKSLRKDKKKDIKKDKRNKKFKRRKKGYQSWSYNRRKNRRSIETEKENLPEKIESESEIDYGDIDDNDILKNGISEERYTRRNFKFRHIDNKNGKSLYIVCHSLFLIILNSNFEVQIQYLISNSNF